MEIVIAIMVVVCFVTFIKMYNNQTKIKRLQKSNKLLQERLIRLEQNISYEKVRKFIQCEVKQLVSNNPNDLHTSHPEQKPISEVSENKHSSVEKRKIQFELETPKIKKVEKNEKKIPLELTKSPESKKRSDFWLSIEKQFAENWTGILGSGILVLGVAFLGTYAALLLEAVYRFLMLTGISALLLGAFFYLKTKAYWKELALWIRSSAAAIFLFACLGSGGIEGLHWIDEPVYALGLLLVGILASIILSFLGKNQTFAALHIVLSLLALSVAQSATTSNNGDSTFLLIGAIITLLGLGTTFKAHKWDYHVLITISAFFVFHIFWVFHAKPNDGFSNSTNLIGIGTVLLVGLTTALTHYRALYTSKKIELIPFLAHLINWFYLIVGLTFHSTDSKYKTIAILAGAIGGFLLARHAKKLKITWLYYTDTLLSQFAFMIGLASLSGWQLDWVSVTMLVFVQCLGFVCFSLYQKERFLYQAGSLLSILLGSLLVLMSYGVFIEPNIHQNLYLGSTQTWYQTPLSLLIASICVIFTVLLDAKYRSQYFKKHLFTHVSWLGIWLGFSLVLIFVMTIQKVFFAPLIVILVILLLLLRQKFNANLLGLGLCLFLVASHLLTWDFLWFEKQTVWSIDRKILYLSSFLLLSGGFIWFSYVKEFKKHFKWIGIYMFAAHLGVSVYICFEAFSPLMVGVLWLLFSALALSLAQFVRKRFGKNIIQLGKPDLYILHTGYLFFTVFVTYHILTNLEIEDFLLGLKVRLWIAVLAMFIILYWFISKKPSSAPVYKVWTHLHPMWLEVLLLFAYMTISVELVAQWQAVLWLIIAKIALIIGIRQDYLSRLQFYALFLFWTSAFQLSFLMNTSVFSASWYEQYRLAGIITIVLQVVFVYLFYKYAKLSQIQFPPLLTLFGKWSDNISKKYNPWVLYPVIICIASYLYFEFDRAILTLLWVIECLIIFILSVILRDNQFRYVALIGIVLCVIRLIGFDMAQESILVKAIVFVGVGGILVGINALYKKYKGRFDA